LATDGKPRTDPAQAEIEEGSRPRATPIRPLLRWAGSKRRQVGRLKLFWRPEHRRYVEPFAGSACLFFELNPAAAILGDKNGELIELYQIARKYAKRLHWRLSHIPRDAQTYARWRKLPADSLDAETRALRFLYLNRNCFNGIYRTNAQGKFNVPMGTRAGAYFSRHDALICAAMLRKATLVADDFERTLALAKRGDFVYLDPPFAVESRRVFREYGRESFDTSDVPRLSKALKRLDAIGADFLVSYADSSEARVLAKRWNSIRLPVRRHVAGFGRLRRNAYEWFISNGSIPEEVRGLMASTQSRFPR
jgi:DNA adenine methylase